MVINELIAQGEIRGERR